MRYLSDFFRLPPLTNDHHSAFRRAISMLPLVALLFTGHPELVPFAALGALVAAFGRADSYGDRVRDLALGSALLTSSTAAGMGVAAMHLPPAVLVGCTAAVAGTVSLVAGASGLKPAGPIYHVLAFGSTAFMPQLPPLAPALAVALGSVAFAFAVCIAGWAVPRVRQTPLALGVRPPAHLAPAGLAYRASLHAVSVGLAGALAVGAGYGYSYWAMMIATVPIGAGAAGYAISRGMHRIIGTFAGLGVSAVLFATHWALWQVAVAMVALRFLMELFVRRHYALSQLFLTPLAILTIQAVDPVSPWVPMDARGVETLIGAGVGMLLAVLSARLGPDFDALTSRDGAASLAPAGRS